MLAGECAAIEDEKERFEKSFKENVQTMQLQIKELKSEIERLETQVQLKNYFFQQKEKQISLFT